MDEPLSPELVLVSPALAAHARAQLAPVQLYEDGLASRPASRASSARPARSSLGRAHVAAGVIVLVGALTASSFLRGSHGERRPSSAEGTLGASARPTEGETPRTSRRATGGVVPQKAVPAARRGNLPPVPPVLGVVAIVGNGSIRLRWQRPPGVVRVVVLRVSGGRTVRQYRGPGLTFVDRGVRGGRTYRYVLVSYDRAGRSSAGVITIIRPRRS